MCDFDLPRPRRRRCDSSRAKRANQVKILTGRAAFIDPSGRINAYAPKWLRVCSIPGIRHGYSNVRPVCVLNIGGASRVHRSQSGPTRATATIIRASGSRQRAYSILMEHWNCTEQGPFRPNLRLVVRFRDPELVRAVYCCAPRFCGWAAGVALAVPIAASSDFLYLGSLR
jgi:hypothetical protein